MLLLRQLLLASGCCAVAIVTARRLMLLGGAITFAFTAAGAVIKSLLAKIHIFGLFGVCSRGKSHEIPHNVVGCRKTPHGGAQDPASAPDIPGGTPRDPR